MATITADVNKLRTATGAGMMDWALVEADGDFSNRKPT
jgi:translation elongation factor EF-Ts